MTNRSSHPRKRSAAVQAAAAMVGYVAAAAGLLLLLGFCIAPERHWWALIAGAGLVVLAVARALWSGEAFMLVWVLECAVGFAVPALVVGAFGFNAWTWTAVIAFAALFTAAVHLCNIRFTALGVR
jgi:hypothetical protein